MQEYRVLIPIGGRLPQAGQLIQPQDADFKGEKINVMVSTIRGITWGTKKVEGEDKVAGVYVDLLGAPWPQLKLTKEQEKAKAKYRHFIVMDAGNGEMKACFNGDDVTQEVPASVCPMCAKVQVDKQNMESVASSIVEMSGAFAARGINIADCKTWDDVLDAILGSQGEARTAAPLCVSCTDVEECSPYVIQQATTVASCPIYDYNPDYMEGLEHYQDIVDEAMGGDGV